MAPNSLPRLSRLAILETQHEDDQRSARDLIAVTELECRRFGAARDIGVDHAEPALALGYLRDGELHHVVVSIHDDQKRRVRRRAA